ncbi:MAG: metal-dependent transcriptional regulator [Clostridia bacterium]|nr:metal-dependent transcriptional regulator [Clostridia bacterium]
MKIHKSAEDYLEMILRLNEEKGYVRSVDIATGLSVSKPSVSVAMKHLREDGYITMDRDNYIALTDSGTAIARRIYDRHKALTRILLRLGVSPETAAEDACKVEHDISNETYAAIVRALEQGVAKEQ